MYYSYSRPRCHTAGKELAFQVCKQGPHVGGALSTERVEGDSFASEAQVALLV